MQLAWIIEHLCFHLLKYSRPRRLIPHVYIKSSINAESCCSHLGLNENIYSKFLQSYMQNCVHSIKFHHQADNNIIYCIMHYIKIRLSMLCHTLAWSEPSSPVTDFVPHEKEHIIRTVHAFRRRSV